MDRLRIAIYGKLSAVVDPDILYFEGGPPANRSNYPYVVFTLPNEIDAHRAKRPTTVEVNIYDAGRSGYNVVQAIEGLTTTIDNALDGSTLLADNLGFKLQNIARNRIPVPEDTNLKRRELRYICRAWFLAS